MTKQDAINCIMDVGVDTLRVLTGLKTNDQIITMLNEKLNIINQIDVSQCKNFISIWCLLEEEKNNVQPLPKPQKEIVTPILIHWIYEYGLSQKLSNGILCF